MDVHTSRDCKGSSVCGENQFLRDTFVSVSDLTCGSIICCVCDCV